MAAIEKDITNIIDKKSFFLFFGIFVSITILLFNRAIDLVEFVEKDYNLMDEKYIKIIILLIIFLLWLYVTYLTFPEKFEKIFKYLRNFHNRKE